MQEKFSERTILISFRSKVDNKFFIRWQLQNKIKMIMLEVTEDYLEDLREICEFLRNFVMKCLRNGETGMINCQKIILKFLNFKFQSGLPPEIPPEDINSFVKLPKLSDAFDRTILMIAAEEGNLTAVNYFINSNISVTWMIKGELAVDFAYKNKNFDIVFALLKANSPFPKDFDANLVSDDLKEFVDLMMNLHECILKGDKEAVRKIIDKNTELR